MQVNTLHITIKIFNNKKRLLNIKKRSNFALIIRESKLGTLYVNTCNIEGLNRICNASRTYYNGFTSATKHCSLKQLTTIITQKMLPSGTI